MLRQNEVHLKGLFPQFAGSYDVDYPSAWKSALFVFDTNVLLSLYRYQPGTCKEFIGTLKALGDQIWIPHYVALEFQRGRLAVLGEQINKFADVKKALKDNQTQLARRIESLNLQKRHSLIDPKLLIAKFDELTNEFLADLERLQAAQQPLTGRDILKEQIEELLDGRVGPAPQRSAVEELYKEAEQRYKARIPPGYQDADKPDSFMHHEVMYRSKFGDFLIWRQMLAYAQESAKKCVILVTADDKEDWWLKIDAGGLHTIGPRPELVDEANSKFGINLFLMYNPVSFLKFAKEYLRTPVSEETLTEVRDIASARTYASLDELSKIVSAATVDWASRRFGTPCVQADMLSDLDFTVSIDSDTHIGFEIYLASDLMGFQNRIDASVRRAEVTRCRYNYREIYIIWAAESLELCEQIATGLRPRTGEKSGIHIMLANVAPATSYLRVVRDFEVPAEWVRSLMKE